MTRTRGARSTASRRAPVGSRQPDRLLLRRQGLAVVLVDRQQPKPVEDETAIRVLGGAFLDAGQLGLALGILGLLPGYRPGADVGREFGDAAMGRAARNSRRRAHSASDPDTATRRLFGGVSLPNGREASCGLVLLGQAA